MLPSEIDPKILVASAPGVVRVLPSPKIYGMSTLMYIAASSWLTDDRISTYQSMQQERLDSGVL